MTRSLILVAGLCFVLVPMPIGEAAPACQLANDQPCVIDGDTFIWRGERIRIANIDAPEVRTAKCDAEQRLGVVAGNRLSQLLASGAVSIIPGDPATGRQRDRHKRLLAIVIVDGQDVGETLVAERLARPWGGRRSPWCN